MIMRSTRKKRRTGQLNPGQRCLGPGHLNPEKTHTKMIWPNLKENSAQFKRPVFEVQLSTLVHVMYHIIDLLKNRNKGKWQGHVWAHAYRETNVETSYMRIPNVTSVC